MWDISDLSQKSSGLSQHNLQSLRCVEIQFSSFKYKKNPSLIFGIPDKMFWVRLCTDYMDTHVATNQIMSEICRSYLPLVN